MNSDMFINRRVHMKDVHAMRLAAVPIRRRWPRVWRSLVFTVLAVQASLLASAPSRCQPVTASSFEFLKQPPFVKTGWTVSTQGIEDSCQVDIVKASLFRILATAVHRQHGPPFDERWVRDGWASSSALLQTNDDESAAIPLRANSERFATAKRIGYSRILRWEFLSAEELIVDIAYRDTPDSTSFIQRVRYRTQNGTTWFLDEILK